MSPPLFLLASPILLVTGIAMAKVDSNATVDGASSVRNEFELRNFRVLSFANESERDSLLQKLLPLFQEALASAHPSDLTIQHLTDSESLEIDGNVTSKNVWFNLLGEMATKANVSDVKKKFQELLVKAKIPGIETELSAAEGNFTDGNKGLHKFAIHHELIMLVNVSFQPGSDANNQVTQLWAKALAPYKVQDLVVGNIEAVVDNKNDADGKILEVRAGYTISGTNAVPIRLGAALRAFQNQMKDANITGVESKNNQSEMEYMWVKSKDGSS